MDIPQEINDYIKESIEFSVGLRVSEKTLELKLQASEEARIRIQDEYYYLQNRLKEKDDLIERARSEASMNAQALKKFVEENQKLAVECGNLLSQCARWEKECSLYDRDREALMEFANEADEKAKDTEIRVIEAEDELRRLREELHCYKQEREMHMITETRATKELQLLREKINEIQCSRSLGCDDNQNGEPHKCPSTPGETLERNLLDTLVSTAIEKDEVATSARAFLETNNGVESYQRLLQMWERLKQPTKNIVALAALVNTLLKDKEHLRINLARAEEEVRVLFEENNILDEENKRLLRQINRERQGSAGKHASSASAKGNKRKSSPRACSSIEMAIDYNGMDSSRLPLSPLQQNSPDSRMHKK